jgi:hypothetical protein
LHVTVTLVTLPAPTVPNPDAIVHAWGVGVTGFLEIVTS